MQKEELEELLKDSLHKSECLFNHKRFKESEIVLSQLLKVDPENFKAMQLLGLCHYRKGENEEAIEKFSESLKIDPSNSENHNNLSLCYGKTGKVEKAIKHMEKAIELNPNKENYYSNLGMLCRQGGDTGKAIELYKKSIKINPNSQHSWINLGSAYGILKELDKAIECFEKAIEIDDKPQYHVDLAYAYHLKGEMKKGWKEYEHRLSYFPQLRKVRKAYDEEKRWTGQDIEGKKIVVYGEQGKGDLIQFSRFIPKLCELSPSSIVFVVPEGTESIFEFGCSFVTITCEDVKDYDHHCSVVSLPSLLEIKDLSLPPSESFRINQNKKIDLSVDNELFKVGIVWAGNPQHPNDLNRSFPLRFFKPIEEVPNVKLFSMQKDLRKRAYPHHPDPIDLTQGADDMKIIDMSKTMETFEDTASIIRELDLVITADTSVAHLAGTIGKETWTLLPFNPDWRWKLEGEQTEWYPNMRLFRQQAFGDWDGLFKDVQKELIEKVKESK